MLSRSLISSLYVIKSVSQRFSNWFNKLPMAPVDPILGTALAYNADKDPQKVNLGVGAYRDDNEKPYVFNVVRKVEQQIINDTKLNKVIQTQLQEYAPIDGSALFNQSSQKLMFGEDNQASKDGRIVTVQALSGTGSLRIGFEFLHEWIPSKVYVSNPTWANHHNIIKRSGLSFVEYPYYDPKTHKALINKFIDTLNQAQPGNIVLLHVCAHNPTGVDPNQDQWKKIAAVMKAKHLFPYFDSAYQGFASGDLIRDAFPVRYFIEQGFNMLVSQSYAKNMGLYGERIGALHMVTSDKDTAAKVLSQIKMVIRPNYSSPPLHGARIAERILSNKQNLEAWKAELKAVAERIIVMRKTLRAKLEQLKAPGTWNHITDQIGMFSYTGLNEKQCECLINKHHIYLVKNGRISMPGINSKNVGYIANAIKDALENVK